MDLPLKAPATTKTYSSTIISTTSNRPNIPPKSVVDMVTSWMGEGGEELDPDRGENRMLPAMTPVLETAACMGSMHSAVVPLIGLAKWTCIYPLIAKVHGTEVSIEVYKNTFCICYDQGIFPLSLFKTTTHTQDSTSASWSTLLTLTRRENSFGLKSLVPKRW